MFHSDFLPAIHFSEESLDIQCLSKWWARSTLTDKTTVHCVQGTMLYLVGLGLADETDITVKGLEVVKRAERVYLEAYTSILHVGKEKLVRCKDPCRERS